MSRPFLPAPLVFSLLISAAGCAVGSGSAPREPASAPSPAAESGEGDGGTADSVLDGVFTDAQAQRGRQVFRSVCSECHSRLDFRGETFFLSWEGTSVGRFVDRIVSSMPESDPGSLPIQQYLDVVAYVLQLNDFPTGSSELEDAPAALERIRIERPGARPSRPPSWPLPASSSRGLAPAAHVPRFP
jgi:hypothetical protein